MYIPLISSGRPDRFSLLDDKGPGNDSQRKIFQQRNKTRQGQQWTLERGLSSRPILPSCHCPAGNPIRRGRVRYDGVANAQPCDGLGSVTGP